MALAHRELTQSVIDAFFEVYNELGSGFLPSVYQKALLVALRPADLSLVANRPIEVKFMDEAVGRFEAQLVVEDAILVEVICSDSIEHEDIEPLRNRLRACEAEVGLLLNFGTKPQFERIVASAKKGSAEAPRTPDRKRSAELRHSLLTERIIGAFFTVYNSLGIGFSERLYENAMQVALRNAGVACASQRPLDIHFRGERVGDFRADLIVQNLVLVELKRAAAIAHPHIAQALNYMKASKIEVGLILNFGSTASFKRLVLDR